MTIFPIYFPEIFSEITKHRNEAIKGNDDGVENNQVQDVIIDDNNTQSAKYLLSLKAGQVGENALDKIMEATQCYVTEILRKVETGVQAKPSDEGVNVPIDFDEIFSAKDMFANLSTTNQRKNYYKEHFGFVVGVKFNPLQSDNAH